MISRRTMTSHNFDYFSPLAMRVSLQSSAAKQRGRITMQSFRRTAVPADDQELHLTRKMLEQKNKWGCVCRIDAMISLQWEQNLKVGRARKPVHVLIPAWVRRVLTILPLTKIWDNRQVGRWWYHRNEDVRSVRCVLSAACVPIRKKLVLFNWIMTLDHD